MESEEWPLTRYCKSILQYLKAISTATLLLLVLFVSLSTTSILWSGLSENGTLIVSMVLFGLLMSIFTSISFVRGGKIAELVYSRIFSNQQGIEKEDTGALVLHTIVYFIVGGLVFSILGLGFELGMQHIASRISTSQSLNKGAVEITTSILKITALLLPVWGTFIGIAIRTYTSQREPNLRDEDHHIISPHQFTAIATLGYFAILIVIIVCIWLLLPSLPKLLAYGLTVLVMVLILIGIGVHTIDETMMEEFTEENKSSDEDSTVRYYR